MDKDEVKTFVEENEVVRGFLSKYSSHKRKGQKSSRDCYAENLCRYFKWLRVVKGWDVLPAELLNDQLHMYESMDISERRKHVRLALEFTRDNPDFSNLSDRRKYALFVTIKGFYEYNEVELTTAKGIFGKRQKRKHHPKQISMSDAGKILGVLGQRERTILLITLQSGLGIGDVLYKFGYMFDKIKPQLEAGQQRVKIEIDERKGYGRWYFTYISCDAIYELKKWLALREKIVERAKKKFGGVSPEIEQGTPIFITNHATPYGENNFHRNYDNRIRYHRMKNSPYEKVSHMFRKLFKTEASIPDRGIDRNIIEFFMGHKEGIEAVGGEYDRTPEIYEEIMEKEYAKLEPHINIYSSPVAKMETDPLLSDIIQSSRLSPGLRDVFTSIVEEAKTRLAKLQKAE